MPESTKRKKSGAEFRKAKKSREKKGNKKLGRFVLELLKPKDAKRCDEHESKSEGVTVTSQGLAKLQKFS